MTTCHLSPTAITAEAKRLLEATIRKAGTDEAAVVEISCTAKRTNCVADLDQEVDKFMTPEERAAFSDGIPGKTGRVISRIFQDELDGTDLSHAQDCLALGYRTHRDGRFEYFYDGVFDLVDLSSTSAKIGVGVMVGGAIALCLISAPAAVFAGAAFVVGGFALSGAAVLKNGIEIAVGDSSDTKDDWRDLGSAYAGLTLAAIPIRPSVKILRESWVPTSILPFGRFAYTQGGLPKLAPPPLSDSNQLLMLLGGRDPSSVLTTRAASFQSGETQLFKIKIHWRDDRTTMFIWDRLEGLLFQIKDGHIVNADPGMWPLIPNLIWRITQRQPLAHVEGITSVEVMEVSKFAAHQMRPDFVLPPHSHDTPF